MGESYCIFPKKSVIGNLRFGWNSMTFLILLWNPDAAGVKPSCCWVVHSRTTKSRQV